MKKMLVVQGIENDLIICEDDEMKIVNIPVSDISFEIYPGRIITLDCEGNYIPDEETEQLRRRKMISLVRRLKNKKRKK